MAGEKNFETRVKRFLDSEGCWHVKFFANQFTKAGIPDLLVCCHGKFIGVELKGAAGRPSPLQLHHVRKIREAGGWAFVMWPTGFSSFRKMIDELRRGNEEYAATYYDYLCEEQEERLK